jgi:hypothetical protein
VAGWDTHEGGSVYGVPLGGTMLRLPFATGGFFFLHPFFDFICFVFWVFNLVFFFFLIV